MILPMRNQLTPLFQEILNRSNNLNILSSSDEDALECASSEGICLPLWHTMNVYGFLVRHSHLNSLSLEILGTDLFSTSTIYLTLNCDGFSPFKYRITEAGHLYCPFAIYREGIDLNKIIIFCGL
jgi:hypothetical protein